jgi:ankyrin repeat protein
LNSLISDGSVDVNARLPRRFQPPALVRAAKRGMKDIVDILLRANARVDDIDERGVTACHAAAAWGDRDMLALLLVRQPKLDIVDVSGNTALCYAVSRTTDDGVRNALMLLEAGASLTAVKPDDLCRFAATSTAAIQALIDYGVVVREIRNSDDVTPLHMAAWYGQDAAVFDMLVNVCGTGLDVRHVCDVTCLHSAASCGNVFAVRWLLHAGADVNSLTSDGSTPLHFVRNYQCAVLLLAAGANLCARDNVGRTALHGVPKWAAPMRSLTAATALIAAGADLDAADDTGETARQALARRQLTIEFDQVEQARREISKARIDFVRDRARQVCIGLQSLRIDALQMCEILQFACGPVAPLIPFHIWWKIATTVKHLRTNLIQ